MNFFRKKRKKKIKSKDEKTKKHDSSTDCLSSEDSNQSCLRSSINSDNSGERESSDGKISNSDSNLEKDYEYKKKLFK